MTARRARIGLAILLPAILIAGIVVMLNSVSVRGRSYVVAYFDNSNGIFRGDAVTLLGVRIGGIDKIEPQANSAKITFWFEDKYPVPADAKAVILSPQLITSRAIALTPAYTGGPRMAKGAVIPLERTAVPVEWDDFRQQLEKLDSSLQPDGPGGVSPLGAFINTTADNLRGQGTAVRDAIIKLSQAFSALGDHSNDIFSTIKNLSVLVSALQSSTTVMKSLNENLAAAARLVDSSADEVGQAVRDIDAAAGDVQGFVADNRDAIGTTTDQLSSLSKTMVESLDDVKQALHVAPNAFQNFLNIYEPAHSSLTGILAVNNFSNPITFLCGAVQAASRLGGEQAAKLCVQYLVPIIKNRQYNFPPIGANPFVGTMARPNELTYSEDWLRPDYHPALPPATPASADASSPSTTPAASDAPTPAAPADSVVATKPAAGLQGLLLPPGSGS